MKRWPCLSRDNRMSFTELRCPLECVVTSKEGAKGNAFAVIDYGPEADLIFVVILEDGQVWCVPNKEIRVASNWTLGRRSSATSKPDRSHERPFQPEA